MSLQYQIVTHIRVQKNKIGFDKNALQWSDHHLIAMLSFENSRKKHGLAMIEFQKLLFCQNMSFHFGECKLSLGNHANN